MSVINSCKKQTPNSTVTKDLYSAIKEIRELLSCSICTRKYTETRFPLKCKNNHYICQDCSTQNFLTHAKSATRDPAVSDSCTFCRVPLGFERPLTINSRDDSFFNIIQQYFKIEKLLRQFINITEQQIKDSQARLRKRNKKYLSVIYNLKAKAVIRKYRVLADKSHPYNLRNRASRPNQKSR